MTKFELNGRVIKEGRAEGTALKSDEALSFFGLIDSKTGVVSEGGHVLEGKSVKNKILVFPSGKGSTVGSYSLYQLKKNKAAPKAIINEQCEPIVAVGAINADIPCVDKIDISKINSGDKIIIDGYKVFVERND